MKMEWQPIEEWFLMSDRPKRFLINDLGAKTAHVKMCFGYGISPNSRLFRQGYTILDDRGNPTKATHWMPLPEPPK